MAEKKLKCIKISGSHRQMSQRIGDILAKMNAMFFYQKWVSKKDRT